MKHLLYCLSIFLSTYINAQDPHIISKTNLTGVKIYQNGAYVSRNAAVYRCPADYALSSIQRQAGWSHRNRSYSG